MPLSAVVNLADRIREEIEEEQRKKKFKQAEEKFRLTETGLQPPAVGGAARLPALTQPPPPTPRELLRQVEQRMQPAVPTLKQRLQPPLTARPETAIAPFLGLGAQIEEAAGRPERAAFVRGAGVAAGAAVSEAQRQQPEILARREIAEKIPGAGGEPGGWQASVAGAGRAALGAAGKVLTTAEEEAFAPLAGRGVMFAEALGFRPGEWEFQKPSASNLGKVLSMSTEEAREFLRDQPTATQVLAEMAIPLFPAEWKNVGQALMTAGRAAKLAEPEVRRLVGEAVPRAREAVMRGEAGGFRWPKPKAVEPPPEAMSPLAPLDDSSQTLVYFLGAPKSEKAQRTLIRRYEGQVTAELDSYSTEIARLRSQAAASGLEFTAGPTRDVHPIIQALDYEGPLDDALRALELTPQEEALARELRRVMDAETALLKRDVPNFTFREFYWPHEIGVPAKPSRVFRGRPIGAKPGFTRARRLQGTITDIFAERPDLTLKTGDPMSILERRLYQGTLYRQQFVLLSEMKRVGLAVRRSQLPTGEVGWRTPKEVAAFNPRPIPGKPDIFTEPWVVPDELASALEDNFGRSLFGGNIPLGTLRNAVAGLKFVKTFGGLFQHVDYSMRALASASRYRDTRMIATIPKAFGRGFVPGLDAKMRAWETASGAAAAVRRRALLKHGINVQAGLAFMGREYEQFAKEFFVYRTPFIGRSLKAFGSATFTNAHREYMLDIGEKLIEGYQRAGMLLDEAAAKVALDMNERFSSLPAWQSILRNPTTRDVMRTAFFSMAEQESWIRMPARQKAFFAAILVNTVALSNMVHLMTTGKLLPPDAYVPFVKNPESPTGFSYNVRFLRPELPWNGPDGRKQYLDLLGQADTPLRIIGDPAMAAAARAGQLPSISGQILAGESAFGEKPLPTIPSSVEELGEIGAFIAEQISPIPAAGFWGEQQRIGWTGAIVQVTGLNVSAERLRDLRNRTAEEESGKTYDDMNRQEKMEYRGKHPDHFVTSSELPEGTPERQAIALSEERTQRIEALGVQLENGEINGPEYREGRSTILQEIAARRSEIPPSAYKPRTEEEKALDVYYRALEERRAASPTQLLAGEDFDAAERAVIDELGEAGQKALTSALTASADRVEKQYLADRQVVDESRWWEVQDLIWQAAAKERGLPSATMSYRDVIDAVETALLDSGIEPTATLVEGAMRDRGWGPVLDGMADARIRLRVNHPDIDARLARWQFSGVTSVRSEDAIRDFRMLTGRDIRPTATGPFKFSDGRVVDGLGNWCDVHDHEVCRLLQ